MSEALALPRSEATAARILGAAESAFSREGLRGARVREIALEAGVSAATLYIYFPSKTALYRAVLDQGMEPVAAILDEIEQSQPEPDLEGLIGRLLRHLAEHPSLSRLVYLEAISEGPFLSHLVETWFRPLFERVQQLLRDGRARHSWPDDEIPLLTRSIVQVIFGQFALAPLFRETGGPDPLATASLREQTRFLVDYFARLFPEGPGLEPTNGDPS